MKLILLGFKPEIKIDRRPIDEFLGRIDKPIKEYCEEENFDYNTFMKIYNNDMSVTIKELVDFANFAVMPFGQFLIVRDEELF